MADLLDDDEFVAVCRNAGSMAHAAAQLGLHFNTFKRKAIALGCYEPNQSGKGIKKAKKPVIPLEEILAGGHPHYQTNKLKHRLLKEEILRNVCSICGLSEWQGTQLICELDHINGDRTDHRLGNLRLLCPNCHSQTLNFRGKNKRRL